MLSYILRRRLNLADGGLDLSGSESAGRLPRSGSQANLPPLPNSPTAQPNTSRKSWGFVAGEMNKSIPKRKSVAFSVTRSSAICALAHTKIGYDQLLSTLGARALRDGSATSKRSERHRTAVQQPVAAAQRQRLCFDRGTSRA